MPPRIATLILTGALLIWSTGIAMTADAQQGDSVTVTVAYTYPRGAGDTAEKARALALFGAKLKAVRLAAKYLTHKGLLEHYEKNQNEIYCLATDEIEATLLEEQIDAGKGTHYVKIRSQITNVDFIRAHIKDLEAEKQEAQFPYNREMEQPVMAVVDPGRELSRAYRYIRQKQWRIAIIYLDHLEKKYPSWGDLYQAKAIAFYGLNDPDRMVEVLNKACALNNQEACLELQSFSPGNP